MVLHRRYNILVMVLALATWPAGWYDDGLVYFAVGFDALESIDIGGAANAGHLNSRSPASPGGSSAAITIPSGMSRLSVRHPKLISSRYMRVLWRA